MEAILKTSVCKQLISELGFADSYIITNTSETCIEITSSAPAIYGVVHIINIVSGLGGNAYIDTENNEPKLNIFFL